MNTDQAFTPDELETHEVRILAVLLGEASAAETAAVESLVTSYPQLKALRARLSLTIGLLRDTARVRTHEKAPAQLSPERREALLAVLANKTSPAPTVSVPKQTDAPNPQAKPRKTVSFRQVLLHPYVGWAGLAACLFLGFAISIPSFNRTRGYTTAETKSAPSGQAASLDFAKRTLDDSSGKLSDPIPESKPGASTWFETAASGKASQKARDSNGDSPVVADMKNPTGNAYSFSGTTTSNFKAGETASASNRADTNLALNDGRESGAGAFGRSNLTGANTYSGTTTVVSGGTFTFANPTLQKSDAANLELTSASAAAPLDSGLSLPAQEEAAAPATRHRIVTPPAPSAPPPAVMAPRPAAKPSSSAVPTEGLAVAPTKSEFESLARTGGTPPPAAAAATPSGGLITDRTRSASLGGYQSSSGIGGKVAPPPPPASEPLADAQAPAMPDGIIADRALLKGRGEGQGFGDGVGSGVGAAIGGGVNRGLIEPAKGERESRRKSDATADPFAAADGKATADSDSDAFSTGDGLRQAEKAKYFRNDGAAVSGKDRASPDADESDVSSRVVGQKKSESFNYLEKRIEQAAPAVEAADKAPLLGDIPVNARLFEGKKKENKGVEELQKAKQAPTPPVEGEELDEAAKVVVKEIKAALTPEDISRPLATADNAFSTFSLNVSDASFRLTRDALNQGTWDATKIRSEEFYNAFQYRDPAPQTPIGLTQETSAHPFTPGQTLVRLGVQTQAQGRAPQQPLHLTVLLDNSGSMERPDRRDAALAALRGLAQNLGPLDTISLVSFSATPRLWLDHIPGDQAAQVAETAAQFPAEGGTNLEAALQAGYEQAEKQLNPGSKSAVILLTDGSANLGNADANSLADLVASNRQRGIAFHAYGVGSSDLNDATLERLARNGDGRYAVLSTPEEAESQMVGPLAGSFRPAALDVKVQVEWNPRRVKAHRLVGFAERRLTKEQFRDNTVDGGELAAAASGNALYSVETIPDGDGPLGTVRVRYRDPATDIYRELSWPVAYDSGAPFFASAPRGLRLAGVAALLAERLQGQPAAQDTNLADLRKIADQLAGEDTGDTAVPALAEMVRQAETLLNNR